MESFVGVRPVLVIRWLNTDFWRGSMTFMGDFILSFRWVTRTWNEYPESYQKASIGTNNQLVIVLFAFGGGLEVSVPKWSQTLLVLVFLCSSTGKNLPKLG